jgi:hypothetical protein
MHVSGYHISLAWALHLPSTALEHTTIGPAVQDAAVVVVTVNHEPASLRTQEPRGNC